MALIRTCAAVVTDGVEPGLEVRWGEGCWLFGHRHDHRTVVKNSSLVNNYTITIIHILMETNVQNGKVNVTCKSKSK